MDCGLHVGAALSVVALVVSTAFLVWLGGRTEGCYRKFGVVVAWIAILLSALLVAGQAYMCFEWHHDRGCQRMMKDMPMMGPGMMQGMGQGMMKGPGMEMHRGMGMGQMPMQQPQPPAGEEGKAK